MLVIGRALATLSDIFVPIVILRVLGKSEVGILGALMLVYGTLAQLLTSGIPETVAYFLPTRTLDERAALSRRVVSALTVMAAIASVLMALAACAVWLSPALVARFATDQATPEVTRALPGMLLAMSLYPLLDMPPRMMPNLLVQEGYVTSSAGLSIFKALGGALALMVPAALGADLRWLVAATLAFGVIYLVACGLMFRTVFVGAKPVVVEVGFKQIFSFGFPLGLTDIVGMVNNSIDRFLILGAYPAARYAEYQAGAWQIPVLTSIAYSVGTAYRPRLVELFKTDRAAEAIQIWRASIAKVSLLVMPTTLIFVVCAEETMELLFSQQYVVAANVFRFFSLLTLGRVAAYGTVIVSAGRPRLVLEAAALSLVANVLVSVPLLWFIGFNGPALGTLIAFVPNVMFYCYAISRATGVPYRDVFPLRAWSRVLALSVVAAAAATAVKLGTDWNAATTLGACAIVLLTTFGVLGTLTGTVERSDWRFLSDIVRLRVFR